MDVVIILTLCSIVIRLHIVIATKVWFLATGHRINGYAQLIEPVSSSQFIVVCLSPRIWLNKMPSLYCNINGRPIQHATVC